MKVRLEKLRVPLGKEFYLPDYSYNHAYNWMGPDTVEITYLVPSTLADAQKAIAPKSQKETPFG